MAGFRLNNSPVEFHPLFISPPRFRPFFAPDFSPVLGQNLRWWPILIF
jgi:hypothetical protein